MSVAAYNPAFYNKLGDISIQSENVFLQDIYGLGKIIVKFGYVEKVCVVIAHRHFDLEENEVMYEFVEDERRIAEPRPYFDIVGKAQANMLSCGGNGIWYPVGYEEADKTFTAWDDSEFLKEVGKYLIDSNLVDKLALATRQSVEEKDNGIVFVEENFQKTRQSITRPSTPEEIAKQNAIPTTYSFNENGATMEEWCVVCRNCVILQNHQHG